MTRLINSDGFSLAVLVCWAACLGSFVLLQLLQLTPIDKTYWANQPFQLLGRGPIKTVRDLLGIVRFGRQNGCGRLAVSLAAVALATTPLCLLSIFVELIAGRTLP